MAESTGDHAANVGAKPGKSYRWVFYTIFNMALVVVPAAIYFLVYAESQERYHTERHFRALNEIAFSLTKHLTIAERLGRYTPVETFRASVLNELGQAQTPDVQNQIKILDEQFRDERSSGADVGSDYQSILRNHFTSLRRSRSFQSVKISRACSLKPLTGPSYHITPLDTDDDSDINAAIKVAMPWSKSRDPGVDCTEVTGAGLGNALEISLNLQDLVAGAAANDTFEQFIVADEKGEVIGSYFGTFAAFTEVSEVIQAAILDGSEGKNNAAVNIVNTPLGQSKTVRLTVGNSDQLFFIRPYEIPIPRSVHVDDKAGTKTAGPALYGTRVGLESERWYLIGTVRQSDFDALVYLIPLKFVGLAALFVVLGILALPLVKMRFIAPHQHLSKTDAGVIVVALILGLALATNGILAKWGYDTHKKSYDTIGANIAEDIAQKFGRELEDSIVTLSSLWTSTLNDSNGVSVTLPAASLNTEGAVVEYENTVVDYECTDARSGADDYCQLVGNKDNELPAFTVVFTLDNNGNQVLRKLSFAKDNFSKLTGLADREYFKRARDRDLWTYSTPGGVCGLGEDNNNAVSTCFYAQRIQNVINGDKNFTISIPILGPDKDAGVGADRDQAGAARVAVLAKWMYAFKSAVLPPSYGFAVIDDDTGEVLFHSDDRKSLVEQFYLETDEDIELIKSVQARQPSLMNGHYLGETTRFHTRPLPHVPWTLVIFYDKAILDTVTFEAGLVSSAVILGYVIILLILLALVDTFAAERAWAWLWPDWMNSRRLSVLRNSLFFILAYVIVGFVFLESPWARFLQAVSVAIAVLFLSILVLSDHVQAKQEGFKQVRISKDTPFGRGHALFAVLAVSLIGVAWSEYAGRDAPSLSTFILPFFLFLVPLVCSFLAYHLHNRREFDSAVVTALAAAPNSSRTAKSLGFFRAQYLGFVVLVLLLIAVLPPIMFYLDAYKSFSDLSIRQLQYETGQRVFANGMHLNALEETLDPSRSLVGGDTFAQVPERYRTNITHSGIRLLSRTDETFVVSRLRFNECDDSCRKLVNQVGKKNTIDLRREEDAKGPVNYLAGRLPFYSAMSADVRLASTELIQGRLWGWFPSGSPVLPPLPANVLVGDGWTQNSNQPLFFLTDGLLLFTAISTVPQFDWIHGGLNSGLELFAIAILAVFAFYIVKAVANRLLGLERTGKSQNRPDHAIGMIDKLSPDKIWEQNRLLIRPSARLLDDLNLINPPDMADQPVVFDLAENCGPAAEQSRQGIIESERRVIVMGVDEALNDDNRRDMALSFMDALIESRQTGPGRAILVSKLNPPGAVTDKIQSLVRNYKTKIRRAESKEQNTFKTYVKNLENAQKHAALWQKICDEINVVRSPLSEGERYWTEADSYLEAVILRECGDWKELAETKDQLLNQLYREEQDDTDRTLTPDQIVRHVEEKGEQLFQSLWAQAKSDEKLALYYLARNHFVNPTNYHVLDRLLKRGLVVHDPALRLCSHAFGNFVLANVRMETIAQWETSAGQSLWQKLRMPLLIGLGLIVLFVIISFGERAQAILALLPAAFGIVPALIQTLSANK